MADLFFNESGDILRDASGDLALTDTPWRDSVQQCYIRMMTDIGDYLTYPLMGCNLSQLQGMSQSPATAQVGINLILAGLTRENQFTNSQIKVNAIPTGYQTIRFDVSLSVGSTQQIKLQIAQNLGIQ